MTWHHPQRSVPHERPARTARSTRGLRLVGVAALLLALMGCQRRTLVGFEGDVQWMVVLQRPSGGEWEVVDGPVRPSRLVELLDAPDDTEVQVLAYYDSLDMFADPAALSEELYVAKECAPVLPPADEVLGGAKSSRLGRVYEPQVEVGIGTSGTCPVGDYCHPVHCAGVPRSVQQSEYGAADLCWLSANTLRCTRRGLRSHVIARGVLSFRLRTKTICYQIGPFSVSCQETPDHETSGDVITWQSANPVMTYAQTDMENSCLQDATGHFECRRVAGSASLNDLPVQMTRSSNISGIWEHGVSVCISISGDLWCTGRQEPRDWRLVAQGTLSAAFLAGPDSRWKDLVVVRADSISTHRSHWPFERIHTRDNIHQIVKPIIGMTDREALCGVSRRGQLWCGDATVPPAGVGSYRRPVGGSCDTGACLLAPSNRAFSMPWSRNRRPRNGRYLWHVSAIDLFAFGLGACLLGADDGLTCFGSVDKFETHTALRRMQSGTSSLRGRRLVGSVFGGFCIEASNRQWECALGYNPLTWRWRHLGGPHQWVGLPNSEDVCHINRDVLTCDHVHMRISGWLDADVGNNSMCYLKLGVVHCPRTESCGTPTGEVCEETINVMPSATHLRVGENTCVFDDSGRVDCQMAHPVEAGPPIEDLATNRGSLCALYQEGGVRCWAHWVEDVGERDGELLDLPPVQKIALGYSHAAFLLENGNVVTMGDNTFGQVLPLAFTIEPISLD